MGIIKFNGVSSTSYGIQVEHPPAYDYPERDYDAVPIPGRNGDMIIDKGTYKNTKRSYDISFGEVDGDYTQMANDVSKWLHPAITNPQDPYVRLEDSYEPDYFRLATFSESGSLSNILQQAGRATINFNCKPQRFLKSGEVKTTLWNTGTLVNNTSHIALPLIIVKGVGDGVLNVGSYKVTITNIINSITIDSDLEDAYNGAINLNMYVTLSNTFPKLLPGNNVVSFSGGINSVEIVPRWWTI